MVDGKVLVVGLVILFGFSATGQAQQDSYKCDFEKGLCSFLTNDQSNKENWKIGRGGVEGRDTGPSVDKTLGTSEGAYLFINVTALGRNTASLLGPQFTDDYCVRFYYHMYGADVGTLKVATREELGVPTTYFQREKSQGDRWKEAHFTISRNGVKIVYQVVFTVEHEFFSLIKGDIALDDIEFTKGACPSNKEDASPLCSFDADDCGYQKGSNLWMWKRYGGTKLIPKDHTLGTVYGGFWHFSPSPSIFGSPSKAILFSPTYESSGKPEFCVHFYYYMNADAVESSWLIFTKWVQSAELRVNVVDSNKNFKNVWLGKKETTKQHTWLYAEAKIEPSDSYQIEFEGLLATQVAAAIAIDDVKVIDGACPEKGHCNFQTDKCTWTDGDGDITWLRNNGKRSTNSEKGPVKDKTTGTSEGYYVFVNIKDKVPNSQAVLESEIFSPSETVTCISFWYVMEGDRVGELEVLKREENDTETLLWSLEGDQSQEWLEAYSPSLPSVSSSQIVFRAITGTGKEGCIALDEIRIIPGRNCSVRPLKADPRNEVLKSIRCSFDDLNFCEWMQTSDSAQWEFGNVTLFESTGPKQPVDGKGHYIFIHAYDKSPVKSIVAKLKSPTIPSFAPDAVCFSFYYYMFGAHVGELRVFIVTQVDDKEEKQIFWRRKGTQPDMWLLLQDTINVPSERNFRFEIEADGGAGFAGDIAIDEIFMTFGQCIGTGLCDFESGTCGWNIEKSKNENYSWLRGVVLPNGPGTDHTTLTESGYYLQAVVEKGALPGDQTNFVSPVLGKNLGSHCLTFWYYRNGYAIGKISVITRTSGGNEALHWSVTQDVGKFWHYAQVSITEKEAFQVVIQAEKGVKDGKEMGIDDLLLANSACNAPAACDFNKDYCSYSLNDTSDFAWLLGTGRVLNTQLIDRPPEDRTVSEGMYVYVDLTIPAIDPGNKAILVSEILEAPVTVKSCLSFFYIVNGADAPTLSVGKMKLNTSGDEPVYQLEQPWSTLVSTGMQWTQNSVQIPLSSSEKYQVYFAVTKGNGHRGFVAVDDVTLEENLCSDVTTAPPQVVTDMPVNSLSCDFDDGTICSWNNVSNYLPFLVSIPKKTRDTMPKFDHTQGNYNGRYAYVNGDTTSQKEYAVMSPTLPLGWKDKFCVSFWYFMNTDRDGRIYVSTVRNRSKNPFTTYWTQAGDYGYRWRHAYVPMKVEGKRQVSIRSRIFKGTIAIDDLAAKDGSCPPSKECTFDGINNMCGFSQDTANDVNWDVKSGEDDDVQYKIVDHTSQSLTGQYLYLAFNGTDDKVNQRSRIFSEKRKPTDASCVTFYYHIYNNSKLALNTYVSTDNGISDPLWSVDQSQGLLWHGARFTAVSKSRDWQVVFEAGVSARGYGQVALDDISVETGECPDPGFCDFEDENCIWENTRSPVSQEAPVSKDVDAEASLQRADFVYDDFDWIRHIGEDYYGPQVDHTLGTPEGFYLLLNAREHKYGERAVYLSERLQTTSVSCFKFWHWIPGVTNGATLRVFSSSDFQKGDLVQLFKDSTEAKWKEAKVSITPQIRGDRLKLDYWIYLAGYVGNNSLGYIAIDDVSVEEGLCEDKAKLFDCGNGQHVLSTDVCNFRNDCENGLDEADCADCDFEKNTCGWTALNTQNADFRWIRSQAGEEGLEFDKTKGDASGHFAVAALQDSYWRTNTRANFRSTVLQNSASTCILEFWYNILNEMGVILNLRRNKQNTELWIPEERSPYTWTPARVILGRNPSSFSVRNERVAVSGGSAHLLTFAAKAPDNHDNSHIALDDISTFGCENPGRGELGYCPKEQFNCKNSVCISKENVCDYNDDCGNFEDESYETCHDYIQRCSFDQSLCDWTLDLSSNSTWTVNKPFESVIQGPTRDHTTGTSTGKFLYLAGKSRLRPARLLGPILLPSEGCTMRFFFEIRGIESPSLQVKTREASNGKEKVVWEAGDPTGGFFFIKQQVTFEETNTYQVIIEGSIGLGEGRANYIALDDVSFNHQCQQAISTLPTVLPMSTTGIEITCTSNEFACGTMNQCIDKNLVCNFKKECADGSDEDHCGACDFTEDMCGLKNVFRFGGHVWERHQAEIFALSKNTTVPDSDSHYDPNGYFAVIVPPPGNNVVWRDATMITPQLQETSHSCKLEFFYHFNVRSGYLDVSVQEPGMGGYSNFHFQLTSNTGKRWQFASVPIGNYRAGIKIMFEGQVYSSYTTGKAQDIAVDNIKYVNCDPTVEYEESLNCTFDEDQCGWHPDNDFTSTTWLRVKPGSWAYGPSTDRTGKNGYILMMDSSWGSRAGTKARIVSLRQPPTEGRCITFWYHMFGQKVGSLNILLKTDNDTKTIWSKSVSQGNTWRMAQRNIISEDPYSIIIEGVQGDYTNPEIAVDDITVLEQICPHPVECDFEADFCDWRPNGWILQMGRGNNPKKDHSTDTEYGRYAILAEEEGTLTSPEYEFSPNGHCLKFWYFIEGDRSTYLQVRKIQETSTTDPPPIWADVPQPGKRGEWLHAGTNIDDLDIGKYMVDFNGHRDNESSVVALDDVRIGDGSCPPYGSCTFEADMCTWRNLGPPYSSGLLWLRSSGRLAGSLHNTLEIDHTTGTSEGWYIYLDGYYGYYGETAVLESENLHSPTACFEYWYFWNGGVGSLRMVYVDHENGNITRIGSARTSKKGEWTKFSKLISRLPNTYKLRLIGTLGSGYSQEIAVDDILIKSDSCDDPITTTPQPTEYPPSRWDCDFESGTFCNWIPGKAWVVQDGRKALVNGSGPWSDHTLGNALGRYAYYNPLGNTDGPDLVSEEIPIGLSDYCFKFWYYLHSPSPVSLQMYAMQNEAISDLIWEKKDSADTAWKYGRFYFEKTVNTSIFLKPMRSELDIGDIALDDIALNEGRCPTLRGIPCDFESVDICGFKTSSPDGILWRRIKASGAKQGPKKDKTFGTKEGHYMIVVPAEVFRVPGNNKAHLIMPNLQSTGTKLNCLRFWYQMNGSNVYALQVYVRTPDGALPQFPRWSHASKHGDSWRVGLTTIVAPFAHEIVFEALMAPGSDGYIALDEVVVNDGQCPSPGSCDFERDMCSWQNADKNVDIEWMRNSGPTPTDLTGPDVDHTYGTSSGSYIYLQAYNPAGKRNLIGILESEFFSVSTVRCLSFWGHMKGSEMGSLSLNLTYFDGDINMRQSKLLYSTEGDQGPNWFLRRITVSIDGLSVEDEYQVLFIGKTKGVLSDIALDDIDVSPGECYQVPEDTFDCKDGSFVNYTQVCDFEKDCSESGEDEARCGDCDFEHGDCGWRDTTQSYYYSSWKRVAGYENGMKNPPGYDHTTNTSSGYFMLVDNRRSYSYQTTFLQSPGETYKFKKSYASCIMKFYYYLSRSSRTTLQVKKRLGSYTFATVWEQTGFEEDWKLGTAYLSSTNNSFHVEIYHMSSYEQVFAAVDDISFENCGLPTKKVRCTRAEFTCSNSVCISRDLLCDLADDCGDGSDESAAVCSTYPKPCTFDTWSDCEWVVKGRAKNKWSITRSQSSRGTAVNSGPITDHTKGTNSVGNYLQLRRSTVDKKYNQSYYYSPNYVLKRRSPCNLRFFYYMYGKDVANLKVHIEFEEDGWSWKTLWSKDGDLGQMWNRGLVRVRDTDPFHFIIEGVLGNGSDSIIAVDDLTLSPECTPFEGNLSLPIPTALPTLSLCNSTQYQCGRGEPHCIPLEKLCDFIEDCWDGSDEYGCGPCDFENDMCNWKDESFGPFAWDRKNGSYEGASGPLVDHMNSSDGYFAYVKEGDGFFYSSADLLSPPLPPTSTHCVLSFWYYIYGKSVGSFTVQQHRSATATRYQNLWKVSGSQAPEWNFKEVKYPQTKKGSVLRFKSEPNRYADIQDVNVAIDEIKFLSCNPTELLLDCDFDDSNFNKGFCFWTQRSRANLKWIRGKGATSTNFTGPSTDHTSGTSDGYYLYINQKDKSPGTVARLESPSVPMNAPDGSCFSFWYHMYGKHIGSLAIEVIGSSKRRMWVKSRSQGRRWLHGEVNILSQVDYKVNIVAISNSGEQGNIAIDDVKLLDGPCPRTAMCDFETDLCGWNTTYDGLTGWIRSQGSGNFSEDKPRVDHTTNSEFGYFLYLPRKRHGDLARLESPYYTNTGSLCVKLWYSMFGSDIGTLAVYQRTNEEGRIENLRGLWKRSGDHVGVWKQGRVTMADLPSFYIAIEAQTGTGITGYIAIDDVQVNHGACSDQGSCNFEIDRCGWSNFDAFSDLDWVRRTGSDINMGYGPMLDHTTSTVQGHYMYAYLTGQPADSRSMLISEDLDLYRDYCLSFYYSMYNALNCTLLVQQSIIGMGWEVISQVNADNVKSDIWEFLETNVSVTPAGEFFNLGLTAVTLSDMDNSTQRGIAVDDISLRKGICGISTEVTTSAPPTTISYPPTRFDCTFEKGLCLWENGESMDAVWEIYTGHKMKNLTRPRTDHTTRSTSGHYITLIYKGWYYYSKAKLFSKEGIEPTSEGVCFKFWYHMYGNTPGTVALKAEDYHDDSKQETLWARTGSQGPSWVYEQVHIVKTFAFRLVFEGMGTRYGSISLDDFSLNYDACPPREFCDVEQDFCGYSNDPVGNIQWERSNGSSNSAGPDIDHTYGSSYGNYFYVKSSENMKVDDIARLESGSYGSDKKCMRFWYYLYGFNVGTLEVFSKQGDTEKGLWKETGDNNDFWQGSEVILTNPMPIPNSFVFQARVGKNFTDGIIAIDDISIRDECPPIGSCTFEEDMCLWTNDPNSDMQWMRGSGEITDAGPETDVTFGTQFGIYLYAHILTTRQSDLKPAQLLSPYFESVANRCINFWSYINGTDKPVLDVLMYDDSQDETDILLDLSTQKPGRWVNEQVQIDRDDTGGKYQIIFQAEITNKVRQFIALDDITVIEKPCVPITPVKPDFTCDNGETHISDDLRCDFYEDCNDKEDELHCGLECDFETDEPDPCNWKVKPSSTMSWNRTKVEKNTEPDIEHTKKLIGEGYFMKITSRYSYNYYNERPSFYGPPLIQASSICRLYFWYYMNVASGDFLSVYYSTTSHAWSTVVFRIEGNQGKNWNLGEAVIGRVIPRFQIGFTGTSRYLSSVLGIDDLNFENCDVPRIKTDSDSCKEGEFRCRNGNCIPVDLLCDFADDCGDYSDENEVFAKCNRYPARCDFQESFCDWKRPRESDYSWDRTTASKSSYSYNPKVTRDHTENSAYGSFLYFSQRYMLRGRVARISSPVMNSKDSSCALRFFYTYGTDYNHTRYQEFFRMSTLTVYTRVDEINVWNPEFSVNEAFGQYYEKAIVPLGHMEDPFEIVIESRVGDYSDVGGWAIDDVSFTDGCEVSNLTLPLSLIKPTTQPTLSPCQENQFTCLSDSSCIDKEQVCDFVNQCEDGSDEARCGTCNFDDDLNPTCGWQNGGSNPWIRIKTLQKSPKNLNDVRGTGYFMYVSKKNQGTISSISVLRSTEFKDAASTCEVSFYYYMSGLGSNDASLKLQLKDSGNRPTILFSEVSDQGQHWQNYNVSIGRRHEGWNLEFVATHVRSKGDIAVDEISFIECAPPEVRVCDRKQDFNCGDGRCIDKSRVCDLSWDCFDGTDESNCSNYLEMCDFENGMCTWTHDSTAYLQWKLTSGEEIVDGAGPNRDHTIGNATGHFLLASNDYTWGMRTARIISTPFKADTSGNCHIRLWYHVYGQYRSFVTIYTQVVGDTRLFEVIKIDGSTGDEWVRLDTNITNKFNFHAVVAGSPVYGRFGEVAIDDITFTPECIPMYTIVTTPLPTIQPSGVCESKGMFECEDNDCIDYKQVCDFKRDCPRGADEKTCPATCNFDDGSTCGWYAKTREGDGVEINVTVAETAQNIVPGPPPKDHTSDSPSGRYLLIHSNLETETGPLDQYVSPNFSSSASTCKFTFWYNAYLYTMVQTVTLRISDENSIDILQLRTTPTNEWNKVEIGVGRRTDTFSMSINSRGWRSRRSYLVVDDIEFIDCALPPIKRSSCQEFRCKKNGACVEFDKVCDMTDDCGDGTDEDNCQIHHFTDFESSFGFFRQLKNDPNIPLRWEIRNTSVPGRFISQTGPAFDHTLSTPSGHYAVFIGRSALNERAWLVSEVFSAEEENRCRMVFYYFMYGSNVNQLNIYNRVKSNGKRSDPLWTKSGQDGNYWQRAQIIFKETQPFEVIVEGKAGRDRTDVIALDDVSFSPECRYISGRTLPPETTTAVSTTTEMVTSCKYYEFTCVKDRVCIPRERVCNFRKDCADGSDEDGCVEDYCDFEGSLCNWLVVHKLNRQTRKKRDVSGEDAVFRWVTIQANDSTTPEWDFNKVYRPKTDHSSNSTAGWYLMADAVLGSFGDTTNLTSPLISTIGSRCDMDFWYYCYSCVLRVYTEKGESNSTEVNLVWNSRDFSYSYYLYNKWKHGKIWLNRLSNFKVLFLAQKAYSSRSVAALDEISFSSCPPPLPPPEGNKTCGTSEFMCDSGNCVERTLLCDYHDDCTDYSDEKELLCQKYVARCSFENGVCPTWHVENGQGNTWTVKSATGSTLMFSSLPRFDHTTGKAEGRFISLVLNYYTRKDKPKFHSDTIDGRSKNCRVRFWFNNIAADQKINVYQRVSYEDGGLKLVSNFTTDVIHFWNRGEVNMEGNGEDFQVVFEGEPSVYSGTINIDDISLTPGCQIVDTIIRGKPTEPTVIDDCAPEKFTCNNGNCYTHLQKCNFIDDCGDNTDEMDCGGDCDFDNSTCGWFTPVAFINRWTRRNGRMFWNGGAIADHTQNTTKGYYMMPSVYAQDFTQLHSGVFVASGPRCKMSLWYYLDGFNVGDLSLLIRYSMKLEHNKVLWKLSGPQGSKWISKVADINTQNFFSMIIESSSGVGWNKFVGIDDVQYIDCEPTHPPIECVSNEWMCSDESKCINIWEYCDGKYDCGDKSDEYKCEKQYGDCSFDSENWMEDCKWLPSEYYGNWSRADKSHTDLTGPERNHNDGKKGYYIFLNSSELGEGEKIAVETPLFNASEGKCHLRFWYYMKGSDSMGMLEILTKGVGGQESPIWEIDGNQGDGWKYGHVIVGSSQDYRVVFLAERGGDDLTDIAVDDVAFTSGCEEGGFPVIPTGPPRECLEGQFRCITDGRCIPGTWRCDCDMDCEDASDEDGCERHCASTGGPKTLPTESISTTVATPLPQKHCNESWKLCGDQKTCIPGLFLCDGIKDCPDNSDENFCTKSSLCEPTFYFCIDRAHPPCIHREKLCDGVKDCSDGSDESLCNECPATFCTNGGNCSLVKRVPVCQCPEGYSQNRCGRKTITPTLPPEVKKEEEEEVKKSGSGWVAGVVIGTALLVGIVVLIWYKRNTNVERQRLPNAIENPAYGLNLESYAFGELNAHVPERDAGPSKSPTAIENPLYAKVPKDKF